MDDARIEQFLADDYLRVVGALALICGDRGRAEDAVQDTLLDVWSRRRDVDDLAGWVTTAGLNRLRSRYRSDAAEQRALQRLAARAGAPVADQDDDDGSVVARLATLPRAQREVVVLHYLLDLVSADVAERLGVATGTVKTHLHRARNALASKAHNGWRCTMHEDELRTALDRAAGAGGVSAPTLGSLRRRRRHRRLRRAGMVVVPVASVALLASVLVPRSDGPVAPPELLAIRQVRADVPRSTDPAPEADIASVVSGDTALALGLYDQLTAADDDNLFFSPYSIATALAMLEPGATGRTRAELQDVLGIEIDDASYHAARNALDRDLAQRHGATKAGPEIDVANGIFGQAGTPFEQPFLETLARFYGAGLQALDFQQDPEAATETINDWVAKHTKGRIGSIFDEPLSPDTVLALVNTIYFHADWKSEFDPEFTRPHPFTRLDGTTTRAELMHQTLSVSHRAGNGWRAFGCRTAAGRR